MDYTTYQTYMNKMEILISKNNNNKWNEIINHVYKYNKKYGHFNISRMQGISFNFDVHDAINGLLKYTTFDLCFLLQRNHKKKFNKLYIKAV